MKAYIAFLGNWVKKHADIDQGLYTKVGLTKMDPGYSIDVIFYPNVRAAWPKRAILAAARLATTTARQEGTPRGGLRLLCAQLEESLCGRLRCPQGGYEHSAGPAPRR